MVETYRSAGNQFHPASFEQFAGTFIDTPYDQYVCILYVFWCKLFRSEILYLCDRFCDSFQKRNGIVGDYFHLAVLFREDKGRDYFPILT